MASSKAIDIFDWQSLLPHPVIGVDEVGRGCLAGPVYAAACIINPENEWQHYTDSKKLTANRRAVLSEEIEVNHRVGIGFATVEEITKLNILNAALLAMKRAILKLDVDTAHVLVDGTQKIPNLEGYEQTTLVKGDLRAAPVAAASIVAKVTRDNVLEDLSKIYPGYGFEKHKGYGTPVHKTFIRDLGPCPEHRPTFAGVKEYL